jgi:2-amino-4-hydroxy-6-hydroxymethyldihydropteridine diphosphokinase
MERVFIGLGSNQGDSVAILKQAIMQVNALPNTRIVKVSSYYQTPAWGGIEQADFINAVLELHTLFTPYELLEQLLDIERQHGRSRKFEQHWGPRRLDCDILLFGQRVLHSESLSIPHRHMAQRAFVLVPLAEIDASLPVPGFGSVQSLLDDLPTYTIERIE